MPFQYHTVSAAKACRILDKAPQTLKKLVKSGAIRVVYVGGKPAFHLTELDRYQRFGPYDPDSIEEQTNAQENNPTQKATQVKESEIFRSDNLGTTLPQEESQVQAGRSAPPNDNQRHAIQVDRRLDGRTSGSGVRVRGEPCPGSNHPTVPAGKQPSEGSRDQGSRLPLDDVEERFHRKVKP